jgi:exodeoxyribonuclease VII small subunit
VETSPGKLEELSFEEKLARLEEIVEKLEEGQMSLRKSLKLFEEAVAIGKSCKGELAEAELRISRLTLDVGSGDEEPDGGANDGPE